MKVSWAPLDKNKFLTYTNSIINLYDTRCIQGEPIPKGSLHISDDLYATSLATLSDVHLTKCVEWYPGTTSDHLIAIGQANGKVLLSNFGRKGTSELIGKEFIPKHLRHCVYLAWNPVHHNLLAEGLDKHRNDCCISIWDVNTRVNSDLPSVTERQRYSSNLAENAVNKPYSEIGMGETTSSFAWFNKEPRTFITGINGKCLRVYDLRDVTKPHLVSHTKYVHGVCSDPLHESRVAAYSENHVSVWDVRNFDKPTLTLPTDRAILKIDWCPTRPGFLAALCRDSSVVKLYDIRHSVIGPDELEPVTFERNIQPYRQHQVVYFAWHPTCENRIITVTPTGNLKDNQIYEKLPMSLSPCMKLSWVFSRKISIQDCGTELDMAARIKLRALQGYGLHSTELWNNAVVVADEPHLHALWHWLDLSTAILHADEAPKKPRSSRYIGVLDLLAQEQANRPCDFALNCWQYPDGLKSNSPERKLVYQYKSEARSRALQFCGWCWFGKEQNDPIDPLSSLLNCLVSENHEYERAAAIALFNLKIGTAVKILSCETAVKENPVLSMVAMALSGFTEEKNALWRKTCTDLSQTLEHPYLRAMFAFLASDKDSYDDVLKGDPCMAVKDRVAFACIYLNDAKLSSYLSELSKHLKETGNLDGILLTGLTNEEGLQLLSKYVDYTCDVQTAALAVIYSSPSELSKDELVLTWIESYRELLDRWQLWHQRAKFDIIRHSVDKTRVPSQAFVSCNFCGKTIACNMALAARSRPSAYSSLPPTNRPKITCCPGCRKPLPRCALCLTNLGTPSGSGLCLIKDKSEYEGKLSSFDSWFTWCQTCRHGGHSSHVTDWFAEHVECSVTGCQCKCMTLDPNSQLMAETPNLQLIEADT
ncbi:GATOR complex protein MIOS-like [Mercenaria mercenaria]|uniref:GATOR complex protein MIOS-like n=1 Tax=Mercenaria mercenaria TaxID=6596 RepID=UPI00234E3B8A|nr:GATOR complex protein MIOS-like [Mercenaria mercenaria]XP_053373893.1 GATOR complex protein MIOS-like [Mercenaria mercenaria]XP_053373894.1 GATOR complex protein MIOS-like [Mercenaria mercenaria]